VADEPTNGELARRLEEIRQMLGGVVGHPEYAADKRALDYRLSSLSGELGDERRDRVAAIDQERRERSDAVKAVNDRITDQAKAGLEHRRHWRELMWQGALPALATIIVGLLALWAAHSGGH
jgi:hypothetical protein